MPISETQPRPRHALTDRSLTWLADTEQRVITTVERIPQWVRVLMVAGVLCALSAATGYRYILEHYAFSFQDEYVYVDAVEKAARGVMVRRNMMVDTYAAGSLACRGMEYYGAVAGTCGDVPPADQLPAFGYTTASIHSPLYFFITAGLVKVLLFLSPSTDLMDAARFTGTLWLGLGLTSLWYLVRAVGGNRVIAAGAVLLMLSSPANHWSNFYVTPDAFSVLAGGLTFLSAVKFAQRKWSPLILVAVSAFMALIKFQMVFASGAALLFLIVYSIMTRDRARWRSLTLWGAGAAVAGLVTQFGYQKLRMALSIPVAQEDEFPLDPRGAFNLHFALDQSDNFFSFLYTGPADYLEYAGQVHALMALASFLFMASLIAGALFVPHLDTLSLSFNRALLISMLVVGPLFYTYISATSGAIFELAPRYAQALLPGLVVSLASVMKTKKLQWGVLAFSVIVTLDSVLLNAVN